MQGEKRNVSTYISYSATDGWVLFFYFFFLVLITTNRRTRGTGARIWGIHQHAAVKSNRRSLGDERSSSGAREQQGTLNMAFVSAVEESAYPLQARCAQVPCRDVILDQYVALLCSVPSGSQYIKLMSFLLNWCISLPHLWPLVLFRDLAVFIIGIYV